MRLVFAAFAAMLLAGSVTHAESAITPAPEEIAYGSDPLQRLDLWRGKRSTAPLILFIHGGGWREGDKRWIGEATVNHFLQAGFAYGSINYRLVPEAAIEQQIQDAASAVAFLLSRAEKLGVRSDRVLLMGHSSGGHLAALIATDPVYLRQVGLEPSVIGGVVLLEGAALAPRVLAPGESRKVHPMFGSPERQLSLSPSSHAAAPNARQFLMLVAGNVELRRQAALLADGLQAAGTMASVVNIPDSDHNLLVSELGSANDHATAVIDELARKVFASPR